MGLGPGPLESGRCTFAFQFSLTDHVTSERLTILLEPRFSYL